jgi:hypothetical protein
VQFVLTLASLIACGFSDPGIIPRGRPRSLTPQRAYHRHHVFFFIIIIITTTTTFHGT